MKQANVSPMTLADFIRGMPDKSPREIVEAANKAGRKLSLPHVYNVRREDKVKTSPRSKRATKNDDVSARLAALTSEFAGKVVEAIGRASIQEILNS